ncbi:MAG: deoxyribonuclease IV [Candidatus Babeliales bacterium]
MRAIGLHIRITSTLTDLITKALRLQIPLFQCFFVQQTTGLLLDPDPIDVQEFLTVRRAHFNNLYVHGSYWVNLASVTMSNHRILHRELELAQKLEFTHMIVHPGSAKGAHDRMEGIDALARTLNTIARKNYGINIILENTAHGNMAIGSDITDFTLLLKKLDNPDAISFCIDTAHAYSYGYDIVDPAGREAFIQLLDTAIGLSRIHLLHVNDTHETLGSKLDRHQVIGQGSLGDDTLKAFIQDVRLRTLPIIMELPPLEEQEEVAILEKVRSWK